MKKFGIIAAGILLAMGTAIGQTVQTVHEIKDGETLSQLAKKYGTTVGDIMRLNGMNTDSKLFVGEKVKIPAAGETVVAGTEKTHTVEKGETLYQLSKKYGVTVNQLRDWNNITGNNIQVGQVLKVSGSDGAEGVPVAGSPATVSAAADPVTAAPDTQATEGNVAADANNSPVPDKQRDQAADAVVNADNTAASNAGASPAVVSNNTSSGNEGAFAVAYKSQANGTELITKGVAGKFQSASGWKDGKYFILMNEVSPGTLVKVQTQGKTIYAKVLWNLGNVKENAGLSYRISDAAAAALGVTEEQSDIIVSYFKSE